MIIPFETPQKQKIEGAKQLSIIYDIISDCEERKQKVATMGFVCSSGAFREIINNLRREGRKVEIGKSLTKNPNHRVITIKEIC